MEAAGLRDILLTFPLVGAAKAERLAALAGEADVVGRRRLGRGRARALAGARRRRRRGGLPRRGRHRLRTAPACRRPRGAAELAELADSLPGLRFDGLMTYPTLPGTGAEAARRDRRDPRPRPRGAHGQRRRHADVLHATTRCRR